jgi:hypothetical protein
VNATVIAAFPPVLDSHPADFAPAVDPCPTDEVSGYVARQLLGGRRPFDVLADPFVLERADDYVSVIDHLAHDPAFRLALAAGEGAGHGHALAA